MMCLVILFHKIRHKRHSLCDSSVPQLQLVKLFSTFLLSFFLFLIILSKILHQGQCLCDSSVPKLQFVILFITIPISGVILIFCLWSLILSP